MSRRLSRNASSLIIINIRHWLARSKKSFFSTLTASDFNPTVPLIRSDLIIKSINERSPRGNNHHRMPHYLSIAPIGVHDFRRFLLTVVSKQRTCVWTSTGWETNINLLKTFCLTTRSGNCILKVEAEYKRYLNCRILRNKIHSHKIVLTFTYFFIA